MENSAIKDYHQIEVLKYTKEKLGTEIFVQVAGEKKMGKSTITFWCTLLRLDIVENALKNDSWDSHIGTNGPGFWYTETEAKYHRFDDSVGTEPLIFSREFFDIKKTYYEVCEEFRLLNNLFHDTGKNYHYAIKDSGEIEEVIKITTEGVFIKLTYLVKYCAAKQMALALFFDSSFSMKVDKINFDTFSKNITDTSYCAKIWGGKNDFSNEYFSILMGKKIVMPLDISYCGYEPYKNKKKVYYDYIIGINNDGTEKKFTSNPQRLQDYFGKNINAPHYLTPVFFSRDVLDKYKQKNEIYKIADGHITCGSLWSLRIDNHNVNYISAYLGDLGTFLPDDEHLHWKRYNILTDGKLSAVKFKRDFMGEFANADISDLKFKDLLFSVNKKWTEAYGWHLFLDLSDKDSHNLTKLSLPLHNNQSSFDETIQQIVKILIDSLAEKNFEIPQGISGSIRKFEHFLKEQNFVNFEVHINFLRKLQTLRSTGVAHRKGKEYEKIAKYFNINDDNYIECADNIFKSANNFLTYIIEEVISKK